MTTAWSIANLVYIVSHQEEICSTSIKKYYTFKLLGFFNHIKFSTFFTLLLSGNSEVMPFCDVFKTSQIGLKEDVFHMTSLRRLNHISKNMSTLCRLWYVSKKMSFYVVFKTSHVHLKKDLYSVMSQIYLRKMPFYDFFKMPQIHLKEDVFHVTSLRRFKHISNKVSILWRLWYVSKMFLKGICGCSKTSNKIGRVINKIDVEPLKTLKK